MGLALFIQHRKAREPTDRELGMGIILAVSITEHLLGNRHCSRPLAYIIFQSFQQPCEEGVHLSDLPMRKLGLSKGKYLTQGHTAHRDQRGFK